MGNLEGLAKTLYSRRPNHYNDSRISVVVGVMVERDYVWHKFGTLKREFPRAILLVPLAGMG